MKRIPDLRSIITIAAALFLAPAAPAIAADPEVEAYLQKIQSAGMAGDMQALFGMNIPVSGPADGPTLELVGKQYGDLIYRSEDQDRFLELTRKTAALLAAMRSRAGVLDAHNVWTGSHIPMQGPVPPNDVKALYDLTGDPQFSLNDYARLVPLAVYVWNQMQGRKLTEDFNLIFDTKVQPGAKAPNTEERGLLMGIVGGYWGDHVDTKKRFNFLNVLKTAAEHFRSLQANPGQLNRYNRKFSSPVFPKLPEKGGISDLKTREKLLSLAAEAVKKNVPLPRYLSSF